MSDRKIDGPVHDLEEVNRLIKEGRVEMLGVPPNLNLKKGEHDFTVTGVVIHEGFQVNWQTISAGFGELYFYLGDDQKIHCSNECMSRNFVRSVLLKLAEDVILDDERST